MKRVIVFGLVAMTLLTVGLVKTHAGIHKVKDIQRSTDYKCLNDCTSGGYMYSYCKRICSY